MEYYSVNKHTSVDGVVTYNIVSYSPDAYVGELVDTQYSDGASTTYWGIFHGRKDECERFIRLHS